MVGIKGTLLRWARVQQDLTMRWIQENGGPSPGYQSEVETEKKSEVHSELLSTWVNVLSVTDAFARGRVPRYHIDSAACHGLAGDIARLVKEQADVMAWSTMDAMERTRTVLRLITHESKHLPRVVLAYVLGVELATLDDMLVGKHPIMKSHMLAIGELTALPEGFFKYGVIEATERPDLAETFLPALRRAEQRGVSMAEMRELVDSLEFLPALRAAHRLGISPARLAAMLETQATLV